MSYNRYIYAKPKLQSNSNDSLICICFQKWSNTPASWMALCYTLIHAKPMYRIQYLSLRYPIEESISEACYYHFLPFLFYTNGLCINKMLVSYTHPDGIQTLFSFSPLSLQQNCSQWFLPGSADYWTLFSVYDLPVFNNIKLITKAKSNVPSPEVRCKINLYLVSCSISNDTQISA